MNLICSINNSLSGYSFVLFFLYILYNLYTRLMRHWHSLSLLFFQDCTDPQWKDLIISFNANYDKSFFFSSYFLCNCPRKVLPSSFNQAFTPPFFFLQEDNLHPEANFSELWLWPLLKMTGARRHPSVLSEAELSLNEHKHTKRASEAVSRCQCNERGWKRDGPWVPCVSFPLILLIMLLTHWRCVFFPSENIQGSVGSTSRWIR